MTTFTIDQVRELLNAKSQAPTHTKAVPAFNTAVPLFASGGMFDAAGFENLVINNYMTWSGIREFLPHVGSNVQNKFWWTLQGMQDDGSTATASRCGDAPSGYWKGCAQFSQFGITSFSTQNIDPTLTHLVDNRGVNTDLTLLGSVINPNNPGLNGLPPDSEVVRSMTAAEMIKVGALFQAGTTNLSGGIQQLGHNREVYQGDPAVKTAQEGYKEYAGFDLLINTGIIDAEDGTLCPAMDSDIRDFGYNEIDQAVGVNGIVRYLIEMESNIQNIARSAGLWPATHVIAMHPQLWNELAHVWPIAYNTSYGATLLSGSTSERQIDAFRAREMETELLRTRTLVINGTPYTVVPDFGIAEKNNATNPGDLNPLSFASDIYFIPLRVAGGTPVTFIEYSNYSLINMNGINPNAVRFWTDGGMYMWSSDDAYQCTTLKAMSEQRLILMTPQLAGRIQNVAYTPNKHMRDANPASPYALDGGVSAGRGPVIPPQASWLT